MTNHRNMYLFFIALIAFVVVSYFLKALSGFLVPVVLGIVLGLIFAPLLIMLRKKKVPMFLTMIIIIVVFLIACFVFTSIMISSLYSISNDFEVYQDKVTNLISLITTRFPYLLNEKVVLGIKDYIFNFIRDNIFSYSKSIFQVITDFISQFLILIFTMIFVLIERSLFYIKIDVLYNNQTNKTKKLTNLIYNINIQISRFLLLKALISLFTGILIYIGFSFIGVDFPIVWAILTFLFNFIPTIGSLIITILSILFSILQFLPEAWGPVIAVILLTTSVQMVVGNFLDPKIMGDNLNLSSLVIWLSLIYWGWVWGIMGAFLAVPLAVTTRIVCEYVPGLRWFSVIMGNSSIMYHNMKAEEQNKQ